jgi:membrane protease YdiL (CAAX protease family)
MLATFFPSLMFGWMRSRTNSIFAPTIAHGASNILIHVLNLSAMR